MGNSKLLLGSMNVWIMLYDSKIEIIGYVTVFIKNLGVPHVPPN